MEKIKGCGETNTQDLEGTAVRESKSICTTESTIFH